MVAWQAFRPTQLLRRLVEGAVDFVVIGGVAVIAQASPRLTKDLDISYATDAANLAALGSVLIALEAELRTIDLEALEFARRRRS